eukprot:6213741-Pleurochrysis_carterae.AAC.3
MSDARVDHEVTPRGLLALLHVKPISFGKPATEATAVSSDRRVEGPARMSCRHISAGGCSNFASATNFVPNTVSDSRQLHARNASEAVRRRNALVRVRKKVHDSGKVEYNVARVDRRVELVQEVWTADNEAGTAVAAGPAHSIKLELEPADGKEWIGWFKEADIEGGSSGAYHRACHTGQAPYSCIKVVAADG